jgi:RNA polymerase sigma-70 factor, ECF subfamily
MSILAPGNGSGSGRSREVEAPSSFDAIYRAHARRVACWAQRLGGPAVDADEAVQEVFLAVNRRLSEFKGEARITTWLFRITARVVANQRRSARRRSWLGRITRRIEDRAPTDRPGPGEVLEEREAIDRFYRVLDGLPERHRNVLVLFELDEMSTEQIASVIDRPAATVRVWLHRARARFTRGWQALGDEGERGTEQAPGKNVRQKEAL